MSYVDRKTGPYHLYQQTREMEEWKDYSGPTGISLNLLPDVLLVEIDSRKEKDFKSVVSTTYKDNQNYS